MTAEETWKEVKKNTLVVSGLALLLLIALISLRVLNPDIFQEFTGYPLVHLLLVMTLILGIVFYGLAILIWILLLVLRRSPNGSS